jgi:hypothetical protein
MEYNAQFGILDFGRVGIPYQTQKLSLIHWVWKNIGFVAVPAGWPAGINKNVNDSASVIAWPLRWMILYLACPCFFLNRIFKEMLFTFNQLMDCQSCGLSLPVRHLQGKNLYFWLGMWILGFITTLSHDEKEYQLCLSWPLTWYQMHDHAYQFDLIPVQHVHSDPFSVSEFTLWGKWVIGEKKNILLLSK